MHYKSHGLSLARGRATVEVDDLAVVFAIKSHGKPRGNAHGKTYGKIRGGHVRGKIHGNFHVNPPTYHPVLV